MTKTLQMVFRNASGKESILSLADPKEDLTQAQVHTIMQDIVTKNIFTTTGGELVQIVESRISTKDSITLV
jgi:hypothetical protein